VKKKIPQSGGLSGSSPGIYFFLAAAFSILVPALPLSARGKQEEPPPQPVNGEFVLCVAAFDVSGLPPSQQTLGFILQRELARDLGRIHHRLRNNEEILRYEELAWTAAMHRAAARLGEKRAERDALLYQGLSRWKYKKELKRIGAELRALEEDFAAAEGEKPLIEGRPLFRISAVNTGETPDLPAGEEAPAGDFPPPPERGEEEAFLRTHNADAVLTGTLRFLYGRIYGEFRIFTRGGSFIYEDSTIFSPEDFNGAADELTGRFLSALSNTEPVYLTIHVEPEEARVLVNEMAVNPGEEFTLFPGPVSILAGADDYHHEQKEVELTGGEQAEFSFSLRPKTMETLGLALAGPGTSVYLGALYLGGGKTEVPEDGAETAEDGPAEAGDGTDPVEGAEIAEAGAVPGDAKEQDPAAGADPEPGPETTDKAETADKAEDEVPGEPELLTLSIPAGEYRYIRIDTEDGLTGEVIVRGSVEDLERRFLGGGSTGGEDDIRIITLKPRLLPGPNDRPVEVRRRKFYGAYGRFWIALPAAFIINGVSQSYINSYNTSGGPELYGKARTAYYVSIGAWVVAGVCLVESLIRLGVYVHTASEESIPLWE
jgi:hypothetical protein